MNNIFENAYFGKAYKTRDGRKAIYWCFDGHYHKLITDDDCAFQPWCDNSGKDHGWNKDATNSSFDIISEWKEEINEEELNRLAWNYVDSIPIPCRYEATALEAFKAGYRKVTETIYVESATGQIELICNRLLEMQGEYLTLEMINELKAYMANKENRKVEGL